MQIKFKINLNFPVLINKKILHDLGKFIKHRILTRIKSGLSTSGRKLKLYSTKPTSIRKSLIPTPKKKFYSGGYKEYRADSGLVTNIANLTLSGDMLNDFTYSVINNEIKFYFKTKKSKEKALINLKWRSNWLSQSKNSKEHREIIAYLKNIFLNTIYKGR